MKFFECTKSRGSRPTIARDPHNLIQLKLFIIRFMTYIGINIYLLYLLYLHNKYNFIFMRASKKNEKKYTNPGF